MVIKNYIMKMDLMERKKLNEMQKNRIISDKRKKTYAETNRYIYIDLWEHEINNNDFRKIKELKGMNL